MDSGAPRGMDGTLRLAGGADVGSGGTTSSPPERRGACARETLADRCLPVGADGWWKDRCCFNARWLSSGETTGLRGWAARSREGRRAWEAPCWGDVGESLEAGRDCDFARATGLIGCGWLESV